MWYYFNVGLAVSKTIALVVSLCSLVGLGYVLYAILRFTNSRNTPKEPIASLPFETEKNGISIFAKDNQLTALRDATITRWHNISKRIASKEMPDYKSAIIEADGLVDLVLQKKGFIGDTMGDRMRSLGRSDLDSLEDLWGVHKIRNDIAHDPHYVVSPRQGQETLEIYKRILEELGVL